MSMVFQASLVIIRHAPRIVQAASQAMMTQMASSNTILQTIVEEDKRGRVMAYYSMALQGVAPFGSLGAGAIAAKVGAPLTIMGGGTLCLCGAVWLYWPKK